MIGQRLTDGKRICRFNPHFVRIAIGKEATDFSEYWGIFH
jgi:hypothetical protein